MKPLDKPKRGDGSKWSAGAKTVIVERTNHNEMNGTKEMTEALKNLFEGKQGTTFQATK